MEIKTENTETTGEQQNDGGNPSKAGSPIADEIRKKRAYRKKDANRWGSDNVENSPATPKKNRSEMGSNSDNASSPVSIAPEVIAPVVTELSKAWGKFRYEIILKKALSLGFNEKDAHDLADDLKGLDETHIRNGSHAAALAAKYPILSEYGIEVIILLDLMAQNSSFIIANSNLNAAIAKNKADEKVDTSGAPIPPAKIED